MTRLQAQWMGVRADIQVSLVRAWQLDPGGPRGSRQKEGQEQISGGPDGSRSGVGQDQLFTEIDLLRLRVTESVVQVQAVDAERIIPTGCGATWRRTPTSTSPKTTR